MLPAALQEGETEAVGVGSGMFGELARSAPRAAAEATQRRWHGGCGGGGSAVAAVRTTSAFLAAGVTGASGGRSLFSPSKGPAHNRVASGTFSQLSLPPLARDQMAGDPTRGFLC